MRNHEKAEQEVEKRRDELFNKIRPMVPAKQVWRPKQKENAYASTLATTASTPPKKDDAVPITSSLPLVTPSSTKETPSPIFTFGYEDDMVDFEQTWSRLLPISLRLVGGNQIQDIYLSS